MYCPNCMKTIDDNMDNCPNCHKSTKVQNPDNTLPVGTVLASRYYVGAVLGQGGFGITYVGCDTRLNKKVAIKEYYPSGFANRYSEHSINVSVSAGDAQETYEHEKQKFIKEAYLLAEFSGDRNVVNVTDILVEHNTAYIVMEYADGETLERYLKRNGKMSFGEAFSMLEPMMESLSQIHAKGLIHRDISPANIIVQPGKHVTLIDFGAAREFDVQAEKSMSVILKHGYAPTEQYQTKGPQGPWTDVYALCATFYKMITGITPPSAIDRIVGDIMKTPSSLGAVISPEEEAVLMKGLSVLQSERFSSMSELHDAFLGKIQIKALEAKNESVPEVPIPNREASDETQMLTPGSKPKPAFSYEATEIIPNREVKSDPEPMPVTQTDQKKGNKKPLVIGGIAGVAAVAGIIIAVNVFSNSSTVSSTAENVAVTEASTAASTVADTEASTVASAEMSEAASSEETVATDSATEEKSEHGFELDHDPVSISNNTNNDGAILKSDFSIYKGTNFTEDAPKLGYDSISIMQTDDGFLAKISGSGIIAYFQGERSVGDNKITDSSECYKLSGALSDFVNIYSSMRIDDLASGREDVKEIWVSRGGHTNLGLDTDKDGTIDTTLSISAVDEVSPDSETELIWNK